MANHKTDIYFLLSGKNVALKEASTATNSVKNSPIIRRDVQLAVDMPSKASTPFVAR